MVNFTKYLIGSLRDKYRRINTKYLKIKDYLI